MGGRFTFQDQFMAALTPTSISFTRHEKKSKIPIFIPKYFEVAFDKSLIFQAFLLHTLL